MTKVLHLKSAVTALPDGTIIGYPPLVDDAGVLAACSGRCPRRRARTSSTSATAGC